MQTESIPRRRFAHLSYPHPAWEEVAEKQKALDEVAQKLYSLPIEDFRKLPYKAAPLPDSTPTIGKDIVVEEHEVELKDECRIRIRLYRPLKEKPSRILFYNVHGGGWMVGNPETEEAQNRLVCFRNNVVVISVDYRRAPEFPFPTALLDSLETLRWIQDPENAEKFGIDPDRIIIGGGSAGANISAAIAQIYRDEGWKGIIGQVLNIPVTCHPDHFPSSKHEYYSYEQNADSSIVNSERMRLYWNYYFPNPQPDPRAIVQVAGMDPLRDEGLAYAEELELAGVDVELKVYAGLPHAFYVYPQLQPTIDYLEAVVDWIDGLINKLE